MTVPQIKVKIVRRPQVKLKVLPRFPSSVTVESPILLDRTGGNYEFSLDVDALTDTLDPLYMSVSEATAAIGGSLTNTRLAKTAAYPVVNADKGKTIALGGTTCYALTFGAASGFDANFAVMVVNEDSGRGKIIALNGLASFILWPLQSIIVYNQNSAWKTLGRSRWKPPASSTLNFYSDFTNGTDTIGATDGLATGTAAFKTVERAFLNAADQIDLNTESQTQIVCNMADNTTDTTGMHAPVHALTGAQGGTAIKIKGGTNSIISVTGADGIAAYFGTVLYLESLTVRSNINGLNALWGSKVYLNNVTFGGGGVVPAGGHITIQDGAQVEQAGAVSIAGDAAYCIYNDAGIYRTAGQSFAFSADAAFSSAFLFAIGPSKTAFGSTTISLNAHTITGKRFAVSNGANVRTGTGLGSLTYFPGSVAGTATEGGSYDTVMFTGGFLYPSFTVAGLPTGVTGLTVFATNARAVNTTTGAQEGAGVGTGSLVSYNGTAWKLVGSNVTAAA